MRREDLERLNVRIDTLALRLDRLENAERTRRVKLGRIVLEELERRGYKLGWSGGTVRVLAPGAALTLSLEEALVLVLRDAVLAEYSDRRDTMPPR